VDCAGRLVGRVRYFLVPSFSLFHNSNFKFHGFSVIFLKNLIWTKTHQELLVLYYLQFPKTMWLGFLCDQI
jgi:hypothetical protein